MRLLAAACITVMHGKSAASRWSRYVAVHAQQTLTWGAKRWDPVTKTPLSDRWPPTRTRTNTARAIRLVRLTGARKSRARSPRSHQRRKWRVLKTDPCSRQPPLPRTAPGNPTRRPAALATASGMAATWTCPGAISCWPSSCSDGCWLCWLSFSGCRTRRTGYSHGELAARSSSAAPGSTVGSFGRLIFARLVARHDSLFSRYENRNEYNEAFIGTPSLDAPLGPVVGARRFCPNGWRYHPVGRAGDVVTSDRPTVGHRQIVTAGTHQAGQALPWSSADR